MTTITPKKDNWGPWLLLAMVAAAVAILWGNGVHP